MKPEAQRIAIAEACGWRDFSVATDHNPDNDRMCYQAGTAPNGNKYCEVPDYLNNLNAMHVAEKVLSANDLVVYAANVTRGKPIWDVMPNDEHFPICPDAIRATAAQRAEAFLRTLNLWKE